MRSVEKAFKPVVDIWMREAERRPETDRARRARLLLMCQVEFGLFAHSLLLRGAAAEDAWVLFSGNPYRAAWRGVDFEDDVRRLAPLRYSLWTIRSRTAWCEALDEYRRFDAPLRAYDVPDAAPAIRKNVSTATRERWDCYREFLRKAPAFAGETLPVARGGLHTFPVGRGIAEVYLPDYDPPPVVSHDFGSAAAGCGAPLSFTWQELLRTAAAMDQVRPEGWVKRLAGIRVRVRHKRAFRRMRRQRITIDGIQHLLGIVGAGKSTLRDVLAVHLARHGLRTTVVVGDVAEQLHLVALYGMQLKDDELLTKVKAAPVIGDSGREGHANRLHNRLLGRDVHSVLGHEDPGFAYLSTACPVSALPGRRLLGAGIVTDPIPFTDAPCGRLSSRGRSIGDEELSSPTHSARRKACPFWSACPRQNAARDLATADIWVATPASLIATPVPWPQNAEKARYLELACRRSDLVIVDEADRVQMQLDEIFAPVLTLTSGGGDPSSLDMIIQHVSRELPSGGRLQLARPEAETWSSALATVQLATARLYAMLVSRGDLHAWVRIGYFNAWNLQLQMAAERYPRAAEDQDPVDPQAQAQREAQTALNKILDDFRNNPFGDRRERPTDTAGDVARLVAIVNELLHTAEQRTTRSRLRELIADLFNVKGLLDDIGCTAFQYAADALEDERDPPEGITDETVLARLAWLRTLPSRFEFTLLLSALEPRLVLVNVMWPRVAALLGLGFNAMYRRPVDYGPMVPEAPMGNMLGFKFIPASGARGAVASGELQFFWNSGIGRELLRRMPDLARVDGGCRTNVLLMSGSSWAGASTRYHIEVPVGVMLEPPREHLERIAEQSVFSFEPLYAGCIPLKVSGSSLDERPGVLRRMAVLLGSSGPDGISRLEAELFRWQEARQHILLLVGSYDEARLVADTLHSLSSRWRNRVLCLVRDDDGDVPPVDDLHATGLRRSDVANLAHTRAQILVAPLLAVERGHNILDEDRVQAAIGSVFFLAKPNPRPDDLVPAVFGINAWAVRALRNGLLRKLVHQAPTVGEGVHAFRKEARTEWFRLLARTMTWRNLGEYRDQVTWDLLVLIWQVIGRLVRGGVEARVIFVDAAFAPQAASDSAEPDTPQTSLLYSMEHVLRPYFERGTAVSPAERQIVWALYSPLWKALGRCLRDLEQRSFVPCIP